MKIIIGNNSSKLAAVSNQVYSQLKLSLDDNLKLTWHWHPIKNHSFIRTHSNLQPFVYLFCLIFVFLFSFCLIFLGF